MQDKDHVAVPDGDDEREETALLRGQFNAAVSLLSECVGPLEVSAAVMESEDGGQADEELIGVVKKFIADAMRVQDGTGATKDARPYEPFLCIEPVCGNTCSGCRRAISPQEMRQYAMRYAFLRDRLIAADFDWNDSGKCVLIFDWPKDVPVGRDCDANIDAALAKARAATP